MAASSVPDHDGGQPPELIRQGGPDLRLTYEVARGLLADDRHRYRQIAISARHGVVTLTGRAGARARETADRIARRTPGADRVRNLIRLTENGTGQPDLPVGISGPEEAAEIRRRFAETVAPLAEGAADVASGYR